MEQLLKACEIADITSGSGRVVEVQGKQIALFNIGGSFHAIDNACPHRGGQLGKGTLDGTAVTCPLHSWQFDVTSGLCTSRPGAKVKAYSVSIQGSAVMVALVSQEVAQSGSNNVRRYLVRFGVMGHLSWFVARGPADYSRRQRVVVQTSRGLEAGEIMAPEVQFTPGAGDDPAGELLRSMTPEDEFQERALRQGEQKAFEDCRRLLAEWNLPVELLDVEQLLDGEKILFYFLGEPSPQMADLTEELAKTYATRVEFRQFMERAEAGCGPGCGTDEAPGCGDEGGCSSCDDGSCAVKDILRKRQKDHARSLGFSV
jgi:nitrite reductase/ring-hydroxylating ferredoxin subunit